jgi:signal transduction histidine kinase
MFLEALVEDCLDQLDDTARNYVDRIRDSAGRMGQLIEDLLRLSRFIGVGLEKEQVDLSGIVAEVLARLRGGQPERKVEADIQPKITANADPGLIKVVLENLLSNAWKYTGKTQSARIEFGERLQDIAAADPGPKTPMIEGQRQFFVKDNGVGFDMELTNKLFAPFQRLHSESQFPGSGIGLATVQRIIHRHGGRVWAEATPGKNATFWFSLPN